ncbi:MAG: DUF459 domain-containing protein [Aestuariivirga sp.]
MLIIATLSGVAQAQGQTPPVDPVVEAPQDATRRILIVGDQLAGGMGAGLARMAESNDTLQVINRFNESSGLARPEIYDWAQAIPKMAEGKSFTDAFVLIGFNDRRDMRDGDNILKFGTPEWDTLYKMRVDAVIDALAAQHIQVFWMGEPPVGDPAMDADLQNITSLQKERVVAKGASFIELRTPFANAQGGYTDRGQDDTGVERRLRESDGVTFFRQGNNRLGQIALAAINSGPLPNIPAPAAGEPVASEQAVPPAEDQGAIFGQDGVNVDGTALGSKDILAGVEQDKVVKQAAAESSIGIGAAKGSNADTLFTTGIAAPAPAGRFDDFNMPPAK